MNKYEKVNTAATDAFDDEGGEAPSRESSAEDFGQKVYLTACIRKILRNCPDGVSILKELVQNADDAGARTLKFCSAETRPQTSSCRNPTALTQTTTCSSRFAYNLAQVPYVVTSAPEPTSLCGKNNSLLSYLHSFCIQLASELCVGQEVCLPFSMTNTSSSKCAHAAKIVQEPFTLYWRKNIVPNPALARGGGNNLLITFMDVTFRFLPLEPFVEVRFGVLVQSLLEDESLGSGYYNQSPPITYQHLLNHAEGIGLDLDGTTSNMLGHMVASCFFRSGANSWDISYDRKSSTASIKLYHSELSEYGSFLSWKLDCNEEDNHIGRNALHMLQNQSLFFNQAVHCDTKNSRSGEVLSVKVSKLRYILDCWYSTTIEKKNSKIRADQQLSIPEKWHMHNQEKNKSDRTKEIGGVFQRRNIKHAHQDNHHLHNHSKLMDTSSTTLNLHGSKTYTDSTDQNEISNRKRKQCSSIEITEDHNYINLADDSSNDVAEICSVRADTSYVTAQTIGCRPAVVSQLSCSSLIGSNVTLLEDESSPRRESSPMKILAKEVPHSLTPSTKRSLFMKMNSTNSIETKAYSKQNLKNPRDRIVAVGYGNRRNRLQRSGSERLKFSKLKP
mmetsp:Transcript_2618/g.3038  ORF Transcript_2618/g.3038 Transcript_2618/m.3038 type:complete len:616 (+) Transcript_2618:373-2220(+)|eukprot:CAMPEP_0194353170 /NCGR_PEP_ID=MMETSP0174-20130528/1510_1 /TAXON_ID=216777 /ORGANISM="Proboscia alata, Strain PI-D3" /LENGTH=615 /DNA_ID=CAMNT_0039121591 /DNA_START=325 /DNA_END=2172 /DNA_ORIENTATION=+